MTVIRLLGCEMREAKGASSASNSQWLWRVPDPRSPSPGFVGHLRLDRESVKFQAVGLCRIVGFQPTGAQVIPRDAWGFKFVGSILLNERSKVYSQILFGEGIGSYRVLPDAAPISVL